MKPADLDAIVASTTDPAAATLARALREAWAEQEHLRELVERASEQVHAVAAERDALNDARNVLTDAVATLTQERDEARAERRAARLDRDAAEEKLAALRGGR